MAFRRLIAAALAGILSASAGPATSSPHDTFGPHNLEAGNRGGNDSCAFCHTPQRAASVEPVWHRQPTEGAFETFDTYSVGGQVKVREGVSIACLSCHDGSQAFDVAPDYDLSTQSAQPVAGRSRIKREHPVGVVYGGFRRRLQRYPFESLQSEMIDGELRWWIDLEPIPNGLRDKSDIILYGRGEGADRQPFIECPTCHDPHANASTRFLRAPDVGSALCYGCHSI